MGTLLWKELFLMRGVGDTITNVCSAGQTAAKHERRKPIIHTATVLEFQVAASTSLVLPQSKFIRVLTTQFIG